MSKQAIRVERIPVANVPQPVWDEIWTFAYRFTDTTREIYERSVRQKDAVTLLRNRETGELIGLGADQTYTVQYDGRVRVIMFAGNVLFDPAFRGLNIFQRLFALQYLRTRLRYPFKPIYGMFDTFSYKSFLMLSRNFKEFWPRRNQQTPEWEAGFIDLLAKQRYGDAWNPERGIVHGKGDRRLRDWVTPIATQEMQVPSIRFFVTKNPGFSQGDLLVCLVPLHARNILSVIQHMLRRRKKRNAVQRTPAKSE